MIDTSNILLEALTQVLETSAFLTVVPSQETPDSPQRFFSVQMHFTGPKCGTLQIVAGFELGKILAQNITGIEPIDDDTAVDAIKELTNVTCGLLLPMLASSDDDLFETTLPEAQDFQQHRQWEYFAGRDSFLKVDVEDSPLLICLTVDDQE